MSENNRRRKSSYRRWKRAFKDALRERFWIFPAALIVVIVLAVSGYWLLKGVQDMRNQGLQAASQQNVASGYRDIVYKGKPYRYNSRITTILYAGVDQREPFVASEYYLPGRMADSISLLILDEYRHKITVLALDRNTITKIHRYTYKGVDRGLYTSQLEFAFSFGDGAKASAKNLCVAVSDLLYGVPVNEYVITNLESFTKISDIIGSIHVKVPNSDLEKFGINEGQDLVINADNMELFVRYRDTSAYNTNRGRMERQQAYINGALNHVKALFENNPQTMWNNIQRLEDVMLTNITRNRYLDLIKTLNNVTYNSQDFYTPPGEMSHGLFDEFRVDEDALLEKVIELFYLEK